MPSDLTAAASRYTADDNQCQMAFLQDAFALADFAASLLDEELATYGDVEKAFINEAVTVSQRNGQVGVCVDHWIPIKSIGQMRTLQRIIKAMDE